jgi:ATP-dependent Lon protease
LNDRLTNPNGKTQPILALKGKPGVGKTHVAEAIAIATGLPFQKINLGGSVDSTIFKGSDNVWSGASPSLLLQLIARSGYNNPIVLLDEVDKLSENMKGLSIQHALLHVLDPLQNKTFQDGFLNEMNHDISNVWFILSMNDDTTLDPALKDRLEIIEIQDYTEEDKIKILENYTLPSLLKEKGLEKGDVVFTKETLRYLVKMYSQETSGMRCLKRIVNDILSKISLWNSVSLKQRESFQFSVPNFNNYPYIIKESYVPKLIQKPNKTASYKTMYS